MRLELLKGQKVAVDKDTVRVLLKIGFALLAAFYVAMPTFLPNQVDGFVIWLNDSTDPVTAYWLDAVRAAAAVSCGVSMFSIGRLMLKFPFTKRFYLFFLPLTFTLAYYISQLVVTTSEVIPRHGFVLINISSTFMMASVAVMANLLCYYYKDR